MQSSLSHTVWEQSHILFSNPDAGRTQPLGIKLGLRDMWAVLLHLYYPAFFPRWHTNSSSPQKRICKRQDSHSFWSRVCSHNMADCEVAAGPWAGGKDGPSHPRDSRFSTAERGVGVLPHPLHRHGYRTLSCCRHQPAFLCFCLKSRAWKA